MSEERARELIREELLRILGVYSSIPLEIDRAFQSRGFVKADSSSGIPKFIGLNDLGSITPVASSTFYVANVSGGVVETAITVTDGIITSA